MIGWLKLNRSICDSVQFANPIDLKIWIWLLCKASISDRIATLKVGRGSTTVRLKRGQMVFGRHAAEHALGIDGSTVYKAIQKMSLDGCISIESNNQYSLITICNYNEFQSNNDDEIIEIEESVTTKEQPKNNQRTTKEQPSSSRGTTVEQQSSSSVTQCKNDNNDLEFKEPLKIIENEKIVHDPVTLFDGENPKIDQTITKPKKVGMHMFMDSEYFDLDKFKEAFQGTKYQIYNIELYYESVLNWATSSGKKKMDWLSTARNFMLSDIKAGKAALAGQDLLKNNSNNGNRSNNYGKQPTGRDVDNESAFAKINLMRD